MPFILGSGGGGGGLDLREPVDVFTGATEAIAEAARSTYFTTTVPTAYQQFVVNRSLAIIIRVTGQDDEFQTYIGGTGAYDDSMWATRTDAVRGPTGLPGTNGSDGRGAEIATSTYTSDSAVQLATTGGQQESPGDVLLFQYTRDFTPAATALTISVNGSAATEIKIQDGNALRDMTLNDIVRYNIYTIYRANTFWHYIGGTRYAEASGVKAWAKAGGGQVPDTEIPAGIMRDAEFTAAAVMGLLGLSAQEVNDILTGVSITNRVVSFTQNDGTTATITLPAGTPDGVIASGAFDASGDTLTLTLADGTDIAISVPAVLRQAGGMADGVIDQADFDAMTYMAALGRSVGADINLDLSAILATITALTARVAALEMPTPHALTRYAALRAMGAMPADFTEADFLHSDSTTSTTQDIQTPDSNVDRVVGIAVPSSEGPLTAVAGLLSDGSLNQFDTMIRGDFLPAVGDAEVTVSISGVDHYVYCTSDVVIAALLGASGYRLTQTAP